MLPTPKDTLGYSKEELQSICKDRGIKYSAFSKAFGVNTAAMAADGTPRYYGCDVERALYKLCSKDGKYHVWD